MMKLTTEFVLLLLLVVVMDVGASPAPTTLPGLANWTWPPHYLNETSNSGSGSGSGDGEKVKPFWMIFFGMVVGLTAVGSVWILKRREETKRKRMHQGGSHDALLNKQEDHHLHEHDHVVTCCHHAYEKSSDSRRSSISSNPDKTLDKVIEIVKAPAYDSPKHNDVPKQQTLSLDIDTDDKVSRMSTPPNINILAPAGRGAPMSELESQSGVSTAVPFVVSDSVSVVPSVSAVTAAMKKSPSTVGRRGPPTASSVVSAYRPTPSELPAASSVSAALSRRGRTSSIATTQNTPALSSVVAPSEPPSASNISHAMHRRPPKMPTRSPALSTAAPPSSVSGLAISVVETSVMSTPSHVPQAAMHY